MKIRNYEFGIENVPVRYAGNGAAFAAAAICAATIRKSGMIRKTTNIHNGERSDDVNMSFDLLFEDDVPVRERG